MLLLFFGNLVVRLPFLFAGYGREEDAWAQALNARIIWETKIYEVSRLPGHPLYELLLAGLWPINHSYLLFNGLTALVSSLSIVVFYKICRKLNLLRPFALSIVFSFIPAFFIAGTFTIDYNFGLLFVLISFLQLLYKRYWLVGILIGIATGIRISHLGFLLPWAILAWSARRDIKPVLKMGFAAGTVALVSYLPPLLTYGAEFLDFHKPPFPGWANVIYKLSFGLWGIPLLVFLVVFFIRNISKPLDFWMLRDYTIRLPKNFFLALVVIFIIQLAVFMRLPFKSEFLIPFLPFAVIYMGAILKRKATAVLAFCSIASCFLFGFDYDNEFRGSPPSKLALTFEAGSYKVFFDPIQGPAIIDHRKRLVKSEFVGEVLNWMENQKEQAYLICGWYWPEIELRTDFPTKVKTDYYATEQELRKTQKAEKEIFYLPEINEANSKINAHYLADSLGKPWKPE